MEAMTSPRDNGPDRRDRERAPSEDRVAARLERAQADEGKERHHRRADDRVAEPAGEGLAPVVDRVAREREQPEDAARDRGIASDWSGAADRPLTRDETGHILTI